MKPLRIQVRVSEPALVAAIEARVRDGLSAGYAEAVIDLLKERHLYREQVTQALARCGGTAAAPAPAAQEDEERLTF